MNNKPLFEDDFEAWPWGPVVRDVYSQTRDFGKDPVNRPIYELRNVGTAPGNLGFEFVVPQGVSEDLKPFIKAVWDSHKDFTGVQLSNSTHADGEPWTIIREQYGSLNGKPKIPNELIQAVFKGKLEKA